MPIFNPPLLILGQKFISPWAYIRERFSGSEIQNLKNSLISPWAYMRGNRVSILNFSEASLFLNISSISGKILNFPTRVLTVRHRDVLFSETRELEILRGTYYELGLNH